MSMFDLKGGNTNNWNYSDPEKDGYTEYIQGTVVQIDNPQSVNFGTGKPEFWQDGNPKRNLRMTLLQVDGTEVNWTFAPHSKSLARQAIVAGMDAADPHNNGNMKMLLGKMVTVWTQAGNYNAQHPRPWNFRIDGEGDASKVRGLIDLSTQAAPAQQAAPAPAAPPAPAMAQVGPSAPPAHVVAQVQQAFGVAPVEVPAAPPAPAGEEVPVTVYDQDIPF